MTTHADLPYGRPELLSVCVTNSSADGTTPTWFYRMGCGPGGTFNGTSGCCDCAPGWQADLLISTGVGDCTLHVHTLDRMLVSFAGVNAAAVLVSIAILWRLHVNPQKRLPFEMTAATMLCACYVLLIGVDVRLYLHRQFGIFEAYLAMSGFFLEATAVWVLLGLLLAPLRKASRLPAHHPFARPAFKSFIMLFPVVPGVGIATLGGPMVFLEVAALYVCLALTAGCIHMFWETRFVIGQMERVQASSASAGASEALGRFVARVRYILAWAKALFVVSSTASLVMIVVWIRFARIPYLTYILLVTAVSFDIAGFVAAAGYYFLVLRTLNCWGLPRNRIGRAHGVSKLSHVRDDMPLVKADAKPEPLMPDSIAPGGTSIAMYSRGSRRIQVTEV